MDLGIHFSEFYRHLDGWLHCTAHSHHPWPDVTRAAQLAYWDDAVRLADRKWERIFGEVVPEAQGHLARHLRLPDPAQIAFAPNTHEFLVRLYSCLDWSRPQRLVTTAHEFHSFARQTRRLEETGRLSVQRVPAQPYETFIERFCDEVAQGCDVVWLSQVFFDSGFLVTDLQRIVDACPPHALVVIDGYHVFAALPVDLSSIADRVFYLGGGYKYAMTGEGACFLAVPPGSAQRPLSTGWFADFSGLDAQARGKVGYGEGGMRFFGATFDASGLYRFNAVMRWLEALQVDFDTIHAHVLALQGRFLDALRTNPIDALPVDALTPPAGIERGNFLTFALPWAAEAQASLAHHRISSDRRGDRLRLGFGIYHPDDFIALLMPRLTAALGSLRVGGARQP
jgi:selenocysteine lyase/cysteine desulfurase